MVIILEPGPLTPAEQSELDDFIAKLAGAVQDACAQGQPPQRVLLTGQPAAAERLRKLIHATGVRVDFDSRYTPKPTDELVALFDIGKETP